VNMLSTTVHADNARPIILGPLVANIRLRGRDPEGDNEQWTF